jgi:hypothetical protein
MIFVDEESDGTETQTSDSPAVFHVSTSQGRISSSSSVNQMQSASGQSA